MSEIKKKKVEYAVFTDASDPMFCSISPTKEQLLSDYADEFDPEEGTDVYEVHYKYLGKYKLSVSTKAVKVK